MHRSRAPSIAPGTFFVAQSWAGCITNMPGFNLRQAQGSKDPAGFDVVVNATPLGMKEGDPLPMDVDRIAPSTFVGEVVMKQEITPFLAAARARGGEIQIGTDMLFEQIPAYLEFFGFRATTPDALRAVAQINYCVRSPQVWTRRAVSQTT